MAYIVKSARREIFNHNFLGAADPLDKETDLPKIKEQAQSFWDRYQNSPVQKARRVFALFAFPACVYHGYVRNQSIGWALWWGLMAGLAPEFTSAVAVGQTVIARRASTQA